MVNSEESQSAFVCMAAPAVVPFPFAKVYVEGRPVSIVLIVAPTANSYCIRDFAFFPMRKRSLHKMVFPFTQCLETIFSHSANQELGTVDSDSADLHDCSASLPDGKCQP